MFDNANSEDADRRHIKFPIVCSALEKRTTLPMIQALIKKLQNFIDFRQSNHPTRHVENGSENGTLISGIKLNFNFFVFISKTKKKLNFLSFYRKRRSQCQFLPPNLRPTPPKYFSSGKSDGNACASMTVGIRGRAWIFPKTEQRAKQLGWSWKVIERATNKQKQQATSEYSDCLTST